MVPVIILPFLSIQHIFDYGIGISIFNILHHVGCSDEIFDQEREQEQLESVRMW